MRQRRCETCVYWKNGGPGRDVCNKPLTKLQKDVLKSLPAAYTVLSGQVHATDGITCPQWEEKVKYMSATRVSTKQCLDVIYELSTCESMAQVAFLIDTMPDGLKEEMKKRRSQARKATLKQITDDAHETQAWIQNRRRKR